MNAVMFWGPIDELSGRQGKDQPLSLDQYGDFEGRNG